MIFISTSRWLKSAQKKIAYNWFISEARKFTGNKFVSIGCNTGSLKTCIHKFVDTWWLTVYTVYTQFVVKLFEVL